MSQFHCPIASTYLLKDYETMYLKYQVLTNIHGQPKADYLLDLFRQLKGNGQYLCSLHMPKFLTFVELT